MVELRGVLRSQVADPLRERAAGLGRCAAAEGATLVAVCPHPALDGLIAGTTGLSMVSQGLADHVLTGLPVVKHVAAAIPGTGTGTGTVAVRLYRLTGVTAEACCPVSR